MSLPRLHLEAELTERHGVPCISIVVLGAGRRLESVRALPPTATLDYVGVAFASAENVFRRQLREMLKEAGITTISDLLK